MMKIGIYGGSFDPPHKGHKLLCENLKRISGVEKVLIIPASLSPFKTKNNVSGEDRFNMCKLNFNESCYEVSDIELARGGKSYTVDTVNQIKNLYPESELYLFMGDDMLLSFNKWYKHEEILKLCKIVCACRSENLSELQNMKDYAENVLGLDGNRCIICESVPFEISSTEIRQADLNEKEKYLDVNVFNYIKSRGLYNDKR
ncbi:MAG: nicotinate (nicotinamide) nucleotide adenylyltransferase [Oscillospiraceae bacterium]|nr:nicotinate (nicotinamide) nucleotide adenylyltransferase [Oscillospiraceae bacterium]